MATAASIVTWILANWGTISSVATGVVTVASTINTMIPPGKPGSGQAALKQLINTLALGLGHATPVVLK